MYQSDLIRCQSKNKKRHTRHTARVCMYATRLSHLTSCGDERDDNYYENKNDIMMMIQVLACFQKNQSSK